jgi:hypothetical protein
MACEWLETALSDIIDVRHGFAFQGEFIHDEPRGCAFRPIVITGSDGW